MFASWSIRRRLPLALVIALAGVVAALSLTSYRAVRSHTLNAVVARVERLALQISSGVDTTDLAGTLAGLRTVADDPRVVDFVAGDASAAGARAALDSFLRSRSDDDPAGVWSPTGVLLLEEPDGGLGWLAATAPEPTETAAVSALQAIDDTTVFYDAVAPVRSGGQIVALVAIRTRLTDATGRTMEAILGPTGALLVGNADGSLWSDGAALTEGPPDAMLTATRAETFERGGAEVLGVAAPYPATPWVVFVEVGLEAALRPAQAFLTRIVAMAGLAVVLGGIGAWLLGRRLTAPLDSLVEAVSGVEAGDYATRVEVTPPAEVARLGSAFNSMAERIERHTGALEEGEARLSSLVNATAQMVWFTDADGRVDDDLPSWRAYTGQTVEEVRGRGWLDAVHPEDRPSFEGVWGRAQGSNGTFGVDCRLRDEDGEYRLFHVRGVPVRFSSAPASEWVGTCTDIEDQRAAERELRRAESELKHAQKMEAIGRLAGGVAHDFNNILTGILASTEFARARSLENPHVLGELDEIRAAARRAADLTKRLLTLSRSRSLSQEILDLNEVVRESARLLERIIGEHIQLRISLAESLAPVRAEAVQLEQIILNLAVNARDAMPRGGRLTLETENVRLGAEYARRHPSVRPGSYVMLAVSDTGIGMDEATLERIFEPFFTTKKEGHGTGLGLATVHGIVKQAGGHVWAYSEPGEGTTLKIYLPVVEGVVAGASRTVLPAETVVGGSEVVLVVEDDPAVRRVAIRGLTSCGYEVLSAGDGGEALEILRERSDVSMVITDMVMPRMSGPELAARLRQEAPRLPILFLSGYAAAAAIGRDDLRGDEPFLQKPFTPADLASAVRSVLDAARSR